MTTHSVDTGDIVASKITIDGDLTWKGNPIAAGDRFEFASGTYAAVIQFRDMPGTDGNRITIINDGGIVTVQGDGNEAMEFTNCSGINWLGNGASGNNHTFPYPTDQETASLGWIIEDEVEWRNGSNILIAYIESTSKYSMRQDVSGKDDIMENIEIHHCYVHDNGAEAFYIGGTGYIFGIAEYEMGDLNMHDNDIRRCNDSIQCRCFISSQPFDVYNNYIEDNETDPTGPFSGALINGGGAHGYFHRNYVNGSEGNGLAYIGGERDVTFTSLSYNNLFVRCGSSHTSDDRRAAVWIGGGASVNTDFYYNTIVTAGDGVKGFGVKAQVTPTTRGFGNIILDTTEGAFNANIAGANKFDNYTDTAADSQTGIAYSIADMKFTNSAGDDYHIEFNSPAVGAGNAGDAPSLDLDRVIRGTPPDVGAYEYLTGSPPWVAVVYVTHVVVELDIA